MQVFAVTIDGHPKHECNGIFKLESLTGSELLASPVLKNDRGMYMYMYRGPALVQGGGFDAQCTWLRASLADTEVQAKISGPAFHEFRVGEENEVGVGLQFRKRLQTDIGTYPGGVAGRDANTGSAHG